MMVRCLNQLAPANSILYENVYYKRQAVTIRGYHFTSIRRAIIKKITSIEKDLKKLEPSYITGRCVK